MAPVDSSLPPRKPHNAPPPRCVAQKRRKGANRRSAEWRITPARGCTEPAPRPFSRGAYYARSDRVGHDIAGDFQEIRFLLHDDRLVTALEHMPDAAMLAIEALRIDSIQLPHALGEIAVRGLDQ